MAKRVVHEEHENHERWLVSYADFITLLFAFFVVLYSVSRTDVAKMAEAAKSIQWAMHYEGTGGVGAPPIWKGPPSEGGCAANFGGSGGLLESIRAIEGMRKKVEHKLRPLLMERQKTQAVTIESDGRRLTVRLAASRFFEPGLAVLQPDAMPVLDAVAVVLRDMEKPIRVEGHTDESSLAGARFRTNWDLSASRAATVTAYLEQAHRIPSTRLSAVGFGSTRPIVPNDTPENRELNRRIAFVVEVQPQDPLSLATP